MRVLREDRRWILDISTEVLLFIGVVGIDILLDEAMVEDAWITLNYPASEAWRQELPILSVVQALHLRGVELRLTIIDKIRIFQLLAIHSLIVESLIIFCRLAIFEGGYIRSSFLILICYINMLRFLTFAPACSVLSLWLGHCNFSCVTLLGSSSLQVLLGL